MKYKEYFRLIVSIIIVSRSLQQIETFNKALENFNNKINTEISYQNVIGINVNCSQGYVGENCDIECGVTYFHQNQKIVGGVVANSYSWPAHAYIKYCSFSGICYICGGTLIDLTTVITAAHCIMGPSFTYYVFLGIQNLNSIVEGEEIPFIIPPPGVYFTVSYAFRHPNYHERAMRNDIGIIKLSKPVVLNKYIQVACLPPYKYGSRGSPYPSINIKGWVVGWGTTNSKISVASNSLRNVNVYIYDGDIYCNYYVHTNWTTQMCAGDYAGGHDTCQGDSGGPLYISDKINGKERYILAGITSYGFDCAQPKYPGMYTRVSPYLDWINRFKKQSPATITSSPLSLSLTSTSTSTSTTSTEITIFSTMTNTLISVVQKEEHSYGIIASVLLLPQASHAAETSIFSTTTVTILEENEND